MYQPNVQSNIKTQPEYYHIYFTTSNNSSAIINHRAYNPNYKVAA